MEKHCKICNNILDISKFYTNGLNKKNQPKYKPNCKSCEYKETKKRFSSILIELLGEIKCSICNYDKCLKAIEFHHIDPSKKERTISHMLNYTKEKIKKELDKCIMVCANCHREIHDKQQD